MRILLAGGTGVLGRRVVPLLLDAGHEVVATSRREASDRWLADAGATPVRLDVFDADAATALVAAEAAEAVVNLATNVPTGNAARRAHRLETHGGGTADEPT